MLLSISIPCARNYNKDFASECLLSIANQKEVENIEFEVIIAKSIENEDEGKVDEFLESHHDLFTHFKVIYCLNSGTGNNRKQGFIEAKGEFISYVDIDDRISPYFIASFIKHSEGEDFLRFSILMYGKNLPHYLPLKIFPNSTFARALHGAFYKRSTFLPFIDSLSSFLKSGQDSLFGFKMYLLSSSQKTIMEFIYYYRIHISSRVSNLKDVLIDLPAIYYEVFDFIMLYQKMIQEKNNLKMTGNDDYETTATKTALKTCYEKTIFLLNELTSRKAKYKTIKLYYSFIKNLKINPEIKKSFSFSYKKMLHLLFINQKTMRKIFLKKSKQ